MHSYLSKNVLEEARLEEQIVLVHECPYDMRRMDLQQVMRLAFKMH